MTTLEYTVGIKVAGQSRSLTVEAEDALVAHPDLAAIYTANDDVALGAMQAVNAANRKGKTLVTGMNGVPPVPRSLGLAAVRSLCWWM
jgi:ABC-type sugar transport system substrate-binding protein